MASRDAAIRVSMRSSAFKSETRSLESHVKGVGRRMGDALKAPMSAGLNSVRKSIAGIGNTLKGTIRTAATLGGALTAGALVKDAINIQSLFRNIAFSISKIPGHVMDWQDVQALVDNAVYDTKAEVDGLAGSFHDVFKATGDASYAAKAMETVGYATVATGESVDSLTQASQLLKRKFGITEASLTDAMTRFIQLTGSGGKSLDELTGRFAVMAGEARQAGMTGTDGVSQLLGMLLLLDESIGEKADPGLKNLFQTLKTGTTQLKRIQKEGRIRIDADATALEKIKQILSSTKARAAAEMTITADARTVFDELARPFDVALEEARSKGLKKSAAIDAALEAFDQNISKASRTTMRWDDILKQHASRVDKDPSIALQDAINKVKRAFSQPKMLNAIEKMAEKLPILAEKITEFVDWVVDNPWQAVGSVAGIKIGGAALGGFAGSAIPSIFSGLFGFGGGGSAMATATRQATKATIESSRKVGLVWRGLAKTGKGAVDGLAKLGAPGAGFSGVAGKALYAASGLAAAGAAGYGLGKVLYDSVVDPAQKADFQNLENVEEYDFQTRRKLQKTSTIEEKFSLLEETRRERERFKKNEPSLWTVATGDLVSLFTDEKSAMEKYNEKSQKLAALQTDTEMAIRNQMAERLKSSGKYNETWDDIIYNMDRLNNVMKKFKDVMEDVNKDKNIRTGVGTRSSSRGPSKPSNANNTPGAAPRRG